MPTSQSPLRATPMPRSHTSPDLSLTEKGLNRAAPTSQPTASLRVSTSKNADKPKSKEICHSPSWSDHGEKQRKKGLKKAEKEQKEWEKRLIKDEEKQKASEIKAGKRLSKKPPPAAMETQKMPPALTRNSWISLISSHTDTGDDKRRSSRDERRLSRMSFGSMKSSQRSQSMPATSAEEMAEGSEQWPAIVSPSAPKLPSFGWSSRRSSSTTRKSPSEVSEAAYDGDIITFAYRLDGATFVDESKKRDRSQARQSPRNSPKKETQEEQPNISAMSLSSNKPKLPSHTGQSSPSTSPQRSPAAERDSSESEKARNQDRPHEGPLSPTASAKGTAGRMVAMMAEEKYGSYRNSPSLQSAPLSQSRPSHDGGSYVHKQRMYQQQQSIAGFEDQMAVQDANDLAAEYEALLPSPQTPQSDRGRTPVSSKLDSTPASSMLDLKIVDQLPEAKIPRNKEASASPPRVKQRHRSNSPHVEAAPIKEHSHKPSILAQDISHQDHAAEVKEKSRVRESMQSAGESVSASRPQASAAFKNSRILGFRRRAKEPPALIAIPYGPENHVLAVQSAPLDAPREEPAAKRSKIERLFRESKPAFAEEGSRRRSASLAKSTAKEDNPKSTQAQSHSRTRTASSTVLNGNLPSLKSLPRSSTEPVLSPITKPIKSALKVKVSAGSPNSKHDAVESKPERPPRKQTTILVDLKPAKRPAADATSAAKTIRPVFSFEVEEKPTNKSMQEVIVESVTGEGLIRKASLTRPRSNPQLQTQTTTSNSLPSLDFLPQLKHQPLVKRERQLPTSPAPPDSTSKTIAQFPTPIAALAYHSSSSFSSELNLKPDLKLLPRSPLRPSQFPLPSTALNTRVNRSATDVGTLSFHQTAIAENLGANPVAKLFVICCKCKFWHDMPSKLYEAMALPMELHKAGEVSVAGARLETAVKCPWCEHGMTTSCCQGWTTVVYLHERHH
jgi:hypothetical protein